MSGNGPYSPLDASRRQIRLLNITSIEPVRGSFEYVSLDDNPKYDTISWCWGDASIRDTFQVDGQLISIPRNATEVLQELCAGHYKLRVWLDAVCINQQDMSERSQQVAIMSDIYSQARQTLVWLGKDDGSTFAAIVTMEDMNAWRKIVEKGANYSDTKEYHEHSRERSIDDPFPLDTDWSAVISLFSAAWFTRFWIIQEVALSRDTVLFCGKHVLPWSLVSRIAIYIVKHISLLKGQLGNDANGIYNARSIASITDVVTFVQCRQDRFDATDARDRAFALYGLLSLDSRYDGLRKAFRPDYSKTLRQVYIDITRALMQTTEIGVSLLLSAQRQVPRKSAINLVNDMPSWVPRYDYVDDPERGSYNGIHHTQPLPSLESDKVEWAADTTDEILCLKGFIVGEIAQVLPPIDSTSPDIVSESVLQALASLWNTVVGLNPQTPEADLATAVRLTLTAASDPHSASVPSFRYFVSHFWPYPKPMDSTDDPADDSDDDDSVVIFGGDSDSELGLDFEDSDGDGHARSEDDYYPYGSSTSESRSEASVDFERDKKEALEFYRTMLDSTNNRPFVFDAHGRLGSAGRDVRPGDLACRLFGLATLVVLRQVGDEFQFISDLGMSDTSYTTTEQVQSPRWLRIA